MHSFESLRNRALEMGFSSAGVARAVELEEEARRLETWLSRGYHGEMSYMERYFDLRTDPQKLMPGTRSVIVLSYNYYQDDQSDPEARIARYAHGKDYHKVLKKKAKELERWMKDEFGDIAFRAFVDSGPVMERVWAHRSGIGWNGKNTLTITPGEGSYFFLMCILTDLVFDYDSPLRDHCGTCTRCIDACPTQAISPEGYILDASRCISYLTIELKSAIPEMFTGQMDHRIFGCDICQEVCPWNRFAKPHREAEFDPLPGLLERSASDWLDITETAWDEITRHSPLRRTGREGMRRNAAFLIKSAGLKEQKEG